MQYLPIILTYTLILIGVSSHIHHECNHNHHIKDIKIRETVQKYNNHPLDKSIPISTRRELIATQSNTEPIRIRPYYDPYSISTSFLTDDEITYIKQLVSVTVKYYQQFVNVIPISGSLQLQRECKTYVPITFGEITLINCITYYDGDTCGNVDVPSDHFGPDFKYRYTGSNNTAYYDTSNSGNGVDDADLIIYVSYGSGGSCGGSTLAYASTCYSDQYGRPVGGTINFCPLMFNGDETWRKDAITTLHEITHVMIMSQSLWSNFKDSNGDTIENVTETYNDQEYIITPLVKEYAQEFYGCDDDDLLPGLPLEDNGGSGSAGSHWEEKYLQSDYMGSTIYSAQTYVSEATLRLMEDSGWYYVDYDYSDPFYWGKNEGCDFFEKDCIGGNGISDTSTWPQYFCESRNDGGCTYDHASRAACQIYTYTTDLPSNMQWFSDSKTGGPQNSAFCPFRQPFTYSGAPDDFEGECKDSRGNNYVSNGGYTSSIFGLDSRCVDVVSSGGSTTGRCFKHVCYGYDKDLGEWEGVNIVIDDTEEIDCERDDAYTSKSSETFKGVTITCPNIDTICGQSSKPFECKYGNYNDDMGECVCNPGYKGDTCSIEDKSESNEATLSTTAVEISYPDGMVDDEPSADDDRYKVCMSDMKYWYLEGEYTFYKMHNWKPSYTARIGGHDWYLFWDIFDKQWELTLSTIAASGSYTSCQTTDMWNSDLETCDGLWSNQGVATYGACPDGARENPEIVDDNELDTDVGNVGIDVKNNKLGGMYVEYIVGGCILFAVLMACICCGVFLYKMRNKRLNKDVVNDEEVADNSVIEEQDVEQEQEVETNTNLEAETGVSLR